MVISKNSYKLLLSNVPLKQDLNMHCTKNEVLKKSSANMTKSTVSGGFGHIY